MTHFDFCNLCGSLSDGIHLPYSTQLLHKPHILYIHGVMMRASLSFHSIRPCAQLGGSRLPLFQRKSQCGHMDFGSLQLTLRPSCRLPKSKWPRCNSRCKRCNRVLFYTVTTIDCEERVGLFVSEWYAFMTSGGEQCKGAVRQLLFCRFTA